MKKDRSIYKLFTIFLAIFFSLFGMTDSDMPTFSLTMSEDAHSEFMKRLRESVNSHPESLLQDSLIAQQANQVKISETELKPKMFLQINSKSPPLDSESDSFFRSLQEKNSSVIDQTLIFEQLITDFGQTKNRVLQQEALIKSGQATGVSEKTKLALKMFDACFDTATYSLLLEISNSSVSRHQEITDLIRIRVESGRAPGRELSRSLARLAEAKARQLLTATNLSEAFANFNSLLPNQNPCKQFPISKFYIEFNQINAIKLAQSENNELRSLNFRIKSLERQLKSVQRSKFPKLKAEVRADKYDISNTDDYNLIGGFKFNWELYQGRKKQLQERNSIEEIKAASFEKEALERNIQSLITSNLAELKQSKLRLQAFAEAYEANVLSREQLKAQFFAANISLLDLLQSERDFMEAAEALILNTKNVRMAEHLYLFYTGTLDSYIMIDQGNLLYE